MSVPVTVLNVTSMGAYRSDAHVGAWSHPRTILDCSHWCLPGVPDAWNELLFSYLLRKGELLGFRLSCMILSSTCQIAVPGTVQWLALSGKIVPHFKASRFESRWE